MDNNNINEQVAKNDEINDEINEQNNKNTNTNNIQGIHVKMDRKIPFITIIIGVLLIAALAFIVQDWWSDRAPSIGTRSRIDHGVLESSVREIGELATLEYWYEAVVTIDGQRTLDIFRSEFGLPGTARHAIIKFEATMRFGIDLADVRITTISLDDGMTEVRVSIPQPTIQTHEIDLNSTQTLSAQTGLFARFNMGDDREPLYNKMREIETRPFTMFLLDHSRSSAELGISSLLSALLDENYYVITFNWR